MTNAYKGVYAVRGDAQGAVLIAIIPPSPIEAMQDALVSASERAAREADYTPVVITSPSPKFQPTFLSSDVTSFEPVSPSPEAGR